MEIHAETTLHQRYIYRGYLQIACCEQTRANHPCLWLITWDPTQPVVTRPLAIQKSGTWYCYGWDLTKNICELFGSNGYINTIYTCTPYGEVTSSGSTAQPLQWSREFYDEELGMVYYRYYHPLKGKWICRDFIDNVGDYNLYTYVNNNTISLFDYLGLQIDWHHLVPQEIKEDLAKDIDINSREYGYHIDSKYHTGKGGVHPSGWNKEWKEWASKQEKPIPKDCVDEQLRKMLNKTKYSILKKYGKKAECPYGQWKHMNRKLKDLFIKGFEKEIEKKDSKKKIAKKAVKKGVASVPVAGWIFSVGFIIADIANGEEVENAVASNIPYVGVAYDAYKISVDIAAADAAFENQFFRNAEPLD